MEPEIETGELIVIKEQANYFEGDVITYETDNILVTHRIIAINKNMITTKGDANNLEDLQISKDQIKGKIVYHSKVIGTFIIYYLKPVLLFFIIMSLGVYIIIGKNKIKKESKNKGEKESEKQKSKRYFRKKKI